MPFRGLEGAGDGGRSCPSRSIVEKALPKDFADGEEFSAWSAPGWPGAEPDMLKEVYGAFVNGPRSPQPWGTLSDEYD